MRYQASWVAEHAHTVQREDYRWAEKSTSTMLMPCRSAFFLAFSSWCGDWSKRVTLVGDTDLTTPCVQNPVPPPTSTTCSADGKLLHPRP